MNDVSKKWEQFLNPEILKSNLILVSLFIAFFESLKDYLVEQPKSFFSVGFSSEEGEIISPEYKEKVLSFDRKNVVNASLLWFKNFEAIKEIDIIDFATLRKYRNKLAHELFDTLFEGLEETIFKENFDKLMALRIKLEKWWTLNIEIPTSGEEYEKEITDRDIMTGTEIIHQLFSDMLSGDSEKASFYLNELRKTSAKPH